MSLSLSELKAKTPTELAEVARSLKLDNVTRLRKQDQIFAILKSQAKRGEKIKGEGVVEILQDGFGFLRSASSSYLAGRTTFMSLRARFAGLGFAPAIRLRDWSARPRIPSATLRC